MASFIENVIYIKDNVDNDNSDDDNNNDDVDDWEKMNSIPLSIYHEWNICLWQIITES